MTKGTMIQTITYYLSEQPSIVNFRWSHPQSLGSTWSFLFTSISFYITFSLFLHLLLSLLLRRRGHRPVPLGPIPAIHSLSMSLISLTIFAGILLSAAAEIRDTRWFWRRSKTPFQWFLCFPLGTRPSGRVFFWSYVFYLSRFLHTFRTYFAILRRRNLSFFRLFNHSILIVMSFLWLEFSQSFQVVAILLTTSVYAVVYGYRFWTAIGLPSACFPFEVSCQVVLLSCNVLCHVGVLLLHFMKGGCNGIEAWVFNSVLNSVILFLFLNFYVKNHLRKRKVGDFDAIRESEIDMVKDKDLYHWGWWPSGECIGFHSLCPSSIPGGHEYAGSFQWLSSETSCCTPLETGPWLRWLMSFTGAPVVGPFLWVGLNQAGNRLPRGLGLRRS